MDNVNRFKKYTQLIIYTLKNDIDNNPLKCKKISELASDAKIDRKQLEAGFKFLFESTIKKYQTLRKMEASQELLDDGRHTISEIAYKCGYDLPNSYSKAFKKIYGQTPTEFQNRTKKDT